MRRARQRGADLDTSSDDSSSDMRRCRILDAQRYENACIQCGLRDRRTRLQALQELHGVLASGYASAPKRLQSTLFEDCLLAVQLQDRHAKVEAAISTLVATAKRMLPQQRRNALLSAHRAACVAATRAARRTASDGSGGAEHGSGDDSDGDVDDDGAVLADVPAEVLRSALTTLDPLSLAAAACVCRSWRALANQLWASHLALVFPDAAQRLVDQQQQHVQETFAAEATRNPVALLPWRSGRALVRGRLLWVHPSVPYGSAAMPLPSAFVSVDQAVDWLLGAPARAVLAMRGAMTSSDSSDGSNSNDDIDDVGSGGPFDATGRRLRRLWALPP